MLFPENKRRTVAWIVLKIGETLLKDQLKTKVPKKKLPMNCHNAPLIFFHPENDNKLYLQFSNRSQI